MRLRAVVLAFAATVATAALLSAVNAYRPVGLLRLASFGAILLLAPAYFALGVLAASWTGVFGVSAVIWGASCVNGALYGLGGSALFARAWPRSKRLAAFAGAVWGIPALVALVLSAV